MNFYNMIISEIKLQFFQKYFGLFFLILENFSKFLNVIKINKLAIVVSLSRLIIELAIKT